MVKPGLAIGVGLAMAACFPPVGTGFLLPLCLAALLWLLEGSTPKQGFHLGFLVGVVWFGADLCWLSNLFGVAAFSLCAILALFPALFAAIVVWFRQVWPRIPLWLWAPVLWTGIEYYRSEAFVLNFSWLGLGYSVVGAPTLLKGAAWFGGYGLTFVIVALAAVLVEARRQTLRMRQLWFGLYGLWLLLYLIPQTPPQPVNPLRVRLVQAGSEDEESFFGFSRPGAGAPADVILWPEYSFVSDPKLNRKLWRKLASVAQENHAYLLFGGKDYIDPREWAVFRNTAYLLDPSGNLVGRHVKNHPVHFIQDGVAGTDASALPTSLGRLGVGICFDMDTPDVARRLAADGADVFLIPNDDPREWGWIQHRQHSLVFQMRAAECGKWLARADVAGGTSIVAPTGQEIAHVKTDGPTLLEGVVGRVPGKTIYVRGGWRFGQLCWFLSLGGLCWEWVRALRKRFAAR